MELDKEALEKAAKELRLFVEAHFDDPTSDLTRDKCVKHIITTYLASLAERGVRLMPREPTHDMGSVAAQVVNMLIAPDALKDHARNEYLDVAFRVHRAMFDAALPAKTEDEE